MYIMLYTMNATDTIAFVDGEYDIFYIVSKDGDDYNSWEWCFTNNIDPIKYRGDDGDEPVSRIRYIFAAKKPRCLRRG